MAAGGQRDAQLQLELEQLLQAALEPRTAKEASEKLRVLLQPQEEQPQNQQNQQRALYVLLVQQVIAGRDDSTRELAAVLLRGKAATILSLLDQVDQRKELLASLLTRLKEESVAVVRRAVCHLLAGLIRQPLLQEDVRREVLAVLCRLVLQQQQQQQQQQEVQQQQQQQQLAALETLVAVVDSAANEELTLVYFEEFFSVFKHAFACAAAAAVGGSSAMQVGALKGLRALAEFCETKQQQRQLCAQLPGVLQAMDAAAAAGGDDKILELGVELAHELMTKEACPLKDGELLVLVEALLRTAANASVASISTRHQALQCIQWLAEEKPRVLCKSGAGVIGQVLDVVVAMAAEPTEAEAAAAGEKEEEEGKEEEDEDDEEEEEGNSAHEMAVQCVDALCVWLPSKYVFRPLLQRLMPMLEAAEAVDKQQQQEQLQQQHVRQRKAALVLLGIMSEGCEGPMRRNIRNLVPLVFRVLGQAAAAASPTAAHAGGGPPSAVVAAAALCLAQFFEYLQPEIMQVQKEALEVLLRLIANPTSSRTVQTNVLYAMDVLFENMEATDFFPAADAVVKNLVNLLHKTRSNRVREKCLAALGSAAAASGKSEDWEEDISEEKEEETAAGGITAGTGAAGGGGGTAAASFSSPRAFDVYGGELFELLLQIVRMPVVTKRWRQQQQRQGKEGGSSSSSSHEQQQQQNRGRGCSAATKARAIGVVGCLVKGTSENVWQQQLPALMKEILRQMERSNFAAAHAEEEEKEKETTAAGGIIKEDKEKEDDEEEEEEAEGLHEIRNEAFTCFGDVCSVLKEKFTIFLQKVMTRVFASLYSTDGLLAKRRAAAALACDSSSKQEGAAAARGEEGGSSSRTAAADDDEDDFHTLCVRDGYLDELESAAVCLKILWECCGIHVLQYLEKSVEAVELLQSHFHEALRQKSCFLTKAIICTAHAAATGRPVSKRNKKKFEFSSAVLQLWQQRLWPSLHALLHEETDKATVADACTAFGLLAEEVGPAIFFSAAMRDEIVADLLQLLEKKHPCQVLQDVDDDDDSRQEEEALFEGVSLLICGMAHAAAAATKQQQQQPSLAAVINKSAFLLLFKRMHPHLLRLATHEESRAFAANGLGCLAEVFLAMGEDAKAFAADPKFLHAIVKGVKQDDDEDYRRNACYCLGVIYEVASSEPAVQAKTEEFLWALSTVFRNKEDLDKAELLTLDNAAAAVARMLLHAPAAATGEGKYLLPLDRLVPALLSALPLQEDHEEAAVVLKAALLLARSPATQPLLQQHIQQFLVAVVLEVAHPASKSVVDASIRREVVAMLQQLLLNPSLPANVLHAVEEAAAAKPFAKEFLLSHFHQQQQQQQQLQLVQ